jgi:3-phosphoshikimate 1-carboxyvinyltransferase
LLKAVHGDVRFAEVMKLMGAQVEYEPNAIVITGPGGKLKAIDHNCNDVPDATMTAAVAALFADGRFQRSLASYFAHCKGI